MERNILFLCTGNSARSQMGEAILRKQCQEHFKVFSAGTEPQTEIFQPVVEVMKEIGLDISDRKPKGIELYLGKLHFEKVIVVCANSEKKCPTIFGPLQRLFWPFDDPAAASGSKQDVLAVCRKVRDEIDMKICEWLKEQGISARPLNLKSL